MKIIICLYCAQGSLFVNNHNIELPYVIVTAYLLKQFRSRSIYYFSVKSVYTSLSVLERCFKYNRLIADSLMDILSRGKIWIISSDQSYMYISTGHTPERHRQTVVDVLRQYRHKLWILKPSTTKIYVFLKRYFFDKGTFTIYTNQIIWNFICKHVSRTWISKGKKSKMYSGFSGASELYRVKWSNYI